MLSREACLDGDCHMCCFLMQEPVRGSSKAKKSAGGPSPASYDTPTRKYGRAWDELTPVSQMLLRLPDRVPAHVLWAGSMDVSSRLPDCGTLLGSLAQLCGWEAAYGAMGLMGACRPHGILQTLKTWHLGLWCCKQLLHVMEVLSNERC